MKYSAVRQFAVPTIFLIISAFPVNAALILNCKTEKRIEIGVCGYGYTCFDKGQELINPFFMEKNTDKWSYKLYADETKLMLIRRDGEEYEWRNVPDKYDADGHQFILNEEQAFVSASVAWVGGSSKSLTVFGDEKRFYLILKDTGAFIEVGSCS